MPSGSFQLRQAVWRTTSLIGITRDSGDPEDKDFVARVSNAFDYTIST